MDDIIEQQIRDAIAGLMLSDHLGDVHREINQLTDALGMERLKGNFTNGWHKQDWENVQPSWQTDERRHNE